MQVLETARGNAPAWNRHVDSRLAERALAAASPLIENAMRDASFGDSGFLHVVVLDPARAPGECALEEAILHERSFGDRAKWDADYAFYARAKAERAWREGRDNPSGAVCLDGIVVGASGAFEPFDQAYAGAVAMWLRALARRRSEGGAA
jgi:hypothetical protein